MIYKSLKRIYIALILIFMYAPIVTLIVLSFNQMNLFYFLEEQKMILNNVDFETYFNNYPDKDGFFGK